MTKLISKIKNFSILEIVFFIFLFLSQIYYSFRYILRYGSAISPKIYTSTPFLFQAGKFASVFIFFIILIVLIIRQFKWEEIKNQFSKKIFWVPTLALMIYLSISMLRFIPHWDSFAFTQNLKMLFVIPFFFVIPFIWAKRSPFDFIKIFLIISIIYHLLFNFLMIGLFYGFGRLPGLAFSEVLGRFGGGWDDPNSFAAFIVLLMVIILVSESKWLNGKNYGYYLTLISLLTISLIYTFSVTGLVGLLIALALLLFFRKLTWKKFLPIPIVMFIFAILFYWLNYFNIIYYGKIGSAGGHLSTGPVTSQGPMTVIGLIGKIIFGSASKIVFVENFYVQFFNNFGLVGIALLLFVLGLTIHRSYKGYSVLPSQNMSDKKLFLLISTVYLFAFICMNLVISLFQDFPINLFIWVTIGLVWTLNMNNFSKENNKKLA